MGVRAGLIALIALGRICCAQSAPQYFEFTIPSSVHPEDAFIRYVITGDDLGGWVKTLPGVSSYWIDVQGRRNASVRAIFYAPGCAIDMLDASLEASANLRHAFVCEPLEKTQIDGTVQSTGWFDGRNVRIVAKLVARWAPGFLGIAKEVPLSIPLAQRVPITADGRFQITVPDFLRDPRSGAANGAGELQIWASDAETGADIAHLIPVGDANSGNRTGSLKIQSSYPTDVRFDVCGVGRPAARLIRRDGFLIRGNEPIESCSH